MKKKPGYIDLGLLSENQQIGTIGDQAMNERKTVGFIVENVKKADRYIQKLKRRFPGIVVIERLPGVPSKHLYSVKVGPPPSASN